jgi:SNF2 family DNA or RNA helicase
MPRVNLLIADDVGLGKTIEAGLILTELLLRRRIQRVLILTPASLRSQWRDEMSEKFALSFDMIDRAETHALRRRLGMDANPWRSFTTSASLMFSISSSPRVEPLKARPICPGIS